MDSYITGSIIVGPWALGNQDRTVRPKGANKEQTKNTGSDESRDEQEATGLR